MNSQGGSVIFCGFSSGADGASVLAQQQQERIAELEAALAAGGGAGVPSVGAIVDVEDEEDQADGGYIKENNLILVQDGSPIHNSKAVQDFIKENRIPSMAQETTTTRCGRKVLRAWPPRSPDLNPIENLWSVLQRTVAETRVYSSEDLSREIKAAFDAYPKDKLNHLCSRFPAWAKQCIKNKGELVLEVEKKP
jgi:transposase